MENNNNNFFIDGKTSKNETNENNQKIEGVINTGDSMLSSNKLNNLTISELNEIKDKEYDKSGGLDDLLIKYTFSTINNKVNLKILYY